MRGSGSRPRSVFSAAPPSRSIEAAPEDRRFRDRAWSDNTLFDFIKQSYLLTARWVQGSVGRVEGLDERTARKLDFYTRQFVDAIAPSNFVLTNPEVLRATIESRGENLVKGLENLLGDLERGKGHLAISMTDQTAFKLGDNVAATPGKIVYQNDLMQLIQYAPATDKVKRRPLLIIPPWINKFYILDLRPGNSFIRWAVAQGHTVFVISWVNPDERLAAKSYEDYMREGPLAALDAMEEATGEREANVIGYCLGGTLLASTLAYMAAKRDTRVKSATYFVTMVDFAEAGELSVFIDEEQLQALEQRMKKKGYLEARDMHTTFNMLRANDLIWSFVVNNYLLGKAPLPVRPLVLEQRFDADAGGDAQLLPAPHVPAEPPGETGRHHPGRGADRSAQRSRPRRSCCRPARTTSRRGARPTRRPRSMPARSSSCCRPRATSPGWSTRPAANTATMKTTPTRRPRTNGSPARPSTRIRGGRCGRSGSPTTPAAKSPPATPATAN